MPPASSPSSAPASEAAAGAAPACRRRFFLTHTLPLLLYLAFITAWSHRSAPAPFPVAVPLDKLAHVLEYLPVGALLARWWGARDRRGGARRALAVVALLGAAFAIADEIHQSFVPGRVADPGDVVADLVGILGGAALWFAWRAFRSERRRGDGVPAAGKAEYTSREGR